MHYVGHRRPHAAHLRPLPVRVPEGRCSRSTSSSPMSAFILGTSQILFFVNFFWSAFKGKKADATTRGTPTASSGRRPRRRRTATGRARSPRSTGGRTTTASPAPPPTTSMQTDPRPHRRAGGEALRQHAWPLPSSRSAATAARGRRRAPPTRGPGRPDGGASPLLGDPARFGLWPSWARSACCSSASRAPTSCGAPPPTGSPSRAARFSGSTPRVLVAEQRHARGARAAGCGAGTSPAAQRWLAATGLLGLLFVAGQFAGWRALQPPGVFLASNPHSSFFYLLTGVHGLHLLGGLVWFAGRRCAGCAAWRFTPGRGRPRACSRPTGTSWASSGLYLLFLLFVY